MYAPLTCATVNLKPCIGQRERNRRKMLRFADAKSLLAVNRSQCLFSCRTTMALKQNCLSSSFLF